MLIPYFVGMTSQRRHGAVNFTQYALLGRPFVAPMAPETQLHAQQRVRKVSGPFSFVAADFLTDDAMQSIQIGHESLVCFVCGLWRCPRRGAYHGADLPIRKMLK